MYDLTKAALDSNFNPEVNVAFERSLFRAMPQEANETMGSFITRLKTRTANCNFHDVDEMITDQIIEKCYSQRLRRKLFERKNVTLKDFRELELGMETAKKSCRDRGPFKLNIYKVSGVRLKVRRHQPPLIIGNNRKCYACGRYGHISGDKECRAGNSKCRFCKTIVHYKETVSAKVRKP